MSLQNFSPVRLHNFYTSSSAGTINGPNTLPYLNRTPPEVGLPIYIAAKKCSPEEKERKETLNKLKKAFRNAKINQPKIDKLIKQIESTMHHAEGFGTEIQQLLPKLKEYNETIKNLLPVIQQIFDMIDNGQDPCNLPPDLKDVVREFLEAEIKVGGIVAPKQQTIQNNLGYVAPILIPLIGQGAEALAIEQALEALGILVLAL